MKKKLLAIAFMLIGAISAVAQEINDTVVSIKDPNEVIILSNGKSTNVAVIGKRTNKAFKYMYTIEDQTPGDDGGWNVDLPFLSKVDNRAVGRTEVISSVSVGWLMPVDCNSMLSGRLDCELTLLRYVYHPKQWAPGLSFGFGIRAAQLTANKNFLFNKDGHELVLEPVEDGISRKSSEISMWSLNIPVLLDQKIYKDFGVKAGVYFNYNFYTTASSSYKISDNQYSTTFKDLHQRMFTTDLYGALYWDFLSVYVRYSPQNIFKNGYGPQFKTISVGLSTNF